ncbi:endosomal P24B protein [Gongronella butleri]|nr:endosomal P24B protein [Gongronella butleri]
MRLFVQSVVLTVCALLSLVCAISIDIDPHGEECFFEYLEPQDKLTVSYQVGEEGSTEIDFWIMNPNNEFVKSTARQATGHHTINALSKGKYTYCFSNRMSSIPAKSVNFNVHDMEHIQDTAEKDINPVEQEIRELAESIFAVKDEQEYIVARERQHRDTAESTNARVKWWSIGQLTLLVVVCFWQVYYLKRFFEVKRVV